MTFASSLVRCGSPNTSSSSDPKPAGHSVRSQHVGVETWDRRKNEDDSVACNLVPAPLPHNERARLVALRDLAILDTGREQAYDDIAHVAAAMCLAPVSMITFVDERRQWFKSAVGFLDRETDRDSSFCAHTILTDELFEVPDATADARFLSNPLVVGEPKIRFYAGAPLRIGGAHRVGALCVIDRVPKSLTDAQRDALLALARSLSHFLELRQITRRLAESLEEVKILSGLLRICMHCKCIRSDRGFWDRLERYVEDNSTARFSHGICPDCMQEHYGELMAGEPHLVPDRTDSITELIG